MHAKIDAEKVSKIDPKRVQNKAKIDAKIIDFSCFFKKGEICKIMLPLQREHDFTGSGHLKIHEKSIQKTYKIDVRKSYAKSMENDAKMEAKWRPISLENLKICEKRHGENRC